MNLSKIFYDGFIKKKFTQGFVTGLVVHRSYDFIQSTMCIDGRLARYDKNGDGKISIGEIIDGVIDDVSNINKIAQKPPFDPTEIFTIKKENDTKKSND